MDDDETGEDVEISLDDDEATKEISLSDDETAQEATDAIDAIDLVEDDKEEEKKDESGGVEDLLGGASDDDDDLFGSGSKSKDDDDLFGSDSKKEKDVKKVDDAEEDLFGPDSDEDEAPPARKVEVKAEEKVAEKVAKKEDNPLSAPAAKQEVPKTQEEPKKAPAKKAAPAREAPSAAASLQEAPAAAKAKPSPVVASSSSQYKLEINVGEATKVGDGMSSYMAYKVTTKTNIPSYKQSEVEVMRRYSDFLTLYKHLVAAYPGIIIAPPPPKDAMGTGMMKFKSSGEEITPFIERRAAALDRYMSRISSHAVIQQDSVLSLFLTTEGKLPKPKSAAGGLMTKLASYTESEDWFDDKVREIDTLDAELKKMHAAAETLVTKRKDLATATVTFAEAFGGLAESEEVPELTKAMHQLSDVEAKVAKLHSKQERRDYYSFSEIIHDYITLVTAIKICFQQRITAYKVWQAAESALMKKKEAEAKLTALNKTEKLPDAAQAVKDAEANVESTKKEFNDMTELLRKELEAFEVQKVQELKATMISFAESMRTLQHQVMKAWEAFLPEVKGISQ